MHRVTVILCTHNRADSLRDTLEAIGRVRVPADVSAVLLVVDNGSTDDTAQVVATTALPNMVVRHVKEPRLGKGYAYNAGIAAAGGDVLLFTDDDVCPPVHWLEGMCRPILSGEADAVAGGVVVPGEYERVLSREPFRSRRGWFASTESLDPARPERLVGANMALSRALFADGLRFDVSLGPGALGFFDETLLSWQLLERGCRLIGRFDVVVEHRFPPDRLTRTSLLSMARRIGRSEAYVVWHWMHGDWVPSVIEIWRARLGLLWRRLANRGDLARGRVAEWEVRRVERLAYYEQLRAEAARPRKYVRRRREVTAA